MTDSIQEHQDIDQIIQGALQDLLKTNLGIAQSVMIHKPFVTRIQDTQGNIYILIDYETTPVYEIYAFKEKSIHLYDKFYNCGAYGSC